MKVNRIILFVITGFLLSTTGLFANEVTETLELHSQALDMIWLVLAASLVFFMQAGFAMVETGFTQAKNAVNILMKNLMDFS
ncbi:MAG: ammonium transporter, partial [Spirochaetales bacterium]|nr:ammonium transporter [Spirochaetales bacterium]